MIINNEILFPLLSLLIYHKLKNTYHCFAFISKWFFFLVKASYYLTFFLSSYFDYGLESSQFIFSFFMILWIFVQLLGAVVILFLFLYYYCFYCPSLSYFFCKIAKYLLCDSSLSFKIFNVLSRHSWVFFKLLLAFTILLSDLPIAWYILSYFLSISIIELDSSFSFEVSCSFIFNFWFCCSNCFNSYANWLSEISASVFYDSNDWMLVFMRDWRIYYTYIWANKLLVRRLLDFNPDVRSSVLCNNKSNYF